MNWLQTIEELKLPPLKSGNHPDPSQGVCAMEMVAFIERLPHSDSPECTCPVIAAFVRAANDNMSHDDRQKLIPILPDLVDTVSPEHEQERAEYFVWLAIHKWAPIALRAAGVDESFITRMEMAGDLVEANTAANAAYAAAYAANAANAAYAANAAAAYAAANAAANAANAAAAYAAAYAANAADINLVDEYNTAIRGALAIGPKSKGFTSLERVPELVELAK